MRALARRAPLACQVALTFIFTWALLPFAATSIPVSLVALCGPAVAAFVVAGLGDPADRRAFHDRLTRWRVSPSWYALALLLPVAISGLRTGIESLLGAPGPVELQAISPLSVVVFALVAGEEIGWRGFMLPRLLPRVGPWRASLIVGVTWAVWHLPLFYMPTMPQWGSPFPAFIVYTTALSVLLTGLALPTGQSVLIATLFHGAVNTFGIVNAGAEPTMRGWTNALAYGIAALLLAATMRAAAQKGAKGQR